MIIYAGISVSLSDVHFSPKVLILLDVTPDQSLLSEGVAREVVNRIQKLRKKVTENKTTFPAQHSTPQDRYQFAAASNWFPFMCNEGHIGVLYNTICSS